MKQKIVLLVALALGMSSICVNAQKKNPVRRTTTQTKPKANPIPKDSREYQVGDDGFEWYKVCKNGKFGAEDRNGNVLVPLEFDNIEYQDFSGKGFRAKVNKYYGFYNPNGKCIIPFTRHYTSITKCTKDKDPDIEKFMKQPFGTWFNCTKEGGYTILCDASGREVCKIVKQSIDHLDVPHYDQGKFYFQIGVWNSDKKEFLYGLMDGNGNVIIQPKIVGLDFSPDKEGNFKDKTGNIVANISSISTTRNPLADNPYDDSSIFSSTTTSGNYQGTNNSDNTTTVVVEHHRDPVPFQEWHACIGCGGTGKMGCDFCGGSGTKYIGDRLHKCSRCNGHGEIPCNVCYGNKGQYVTVYK